METEQKRDKREYDGEWTACGVILGIIMFLLFFIIFLLLKSPKTNDFGDNNSYIDLIEEINNNCGSVFITKCIGVSEKWCVFLQDCKDGGYCKSIYKPVEECLK